MYGDFAERCYDAGHKEGYEKGYEAGYKQACLDAKNAQRREEAEKRRMISEIVGTSISEDTLKHTKDSFRRAADKRWEERNK